MTLTIRIIATVAFVGIATVSFAGIPNVNDRELALLSVLALLAYGEDPGDLVSWEGGKEFRGKTVLIQKGHTSSRIEIQRNAFEGTPQIEQFDVERFHGAIWKVNVMWSVELKEGPANLINGQCKKIKGTYMLRYEFLELVGKVCRFRDGISVTK